MAGERERSGGFDVRRLVERAVRRAVQEAVASATSLRGRYAPVVRLTLSERGGGGVEFFVRDIDDPSLVSKPSVADAWWRPIRFVHGSRTEVVSLVRRLRRGGRAFAPISRAVRSADPLRVAVTDDEIALLLGEAGKKLTRQGFVIQLPAQLTAEGRARLRARLRVGDTAENASLPAWGMGAAATEPFRWEVALGDLEITADEFFEIARAKRSTVRVRGKWVAVDPGELAEAARVFGDNTEGRMPAAQAAGLALAGELAVTKAVSATVVAAGRVERAAVAARDVAVERDADQPREFVGTLRPYQRRGLAWLKHLENADVGGILADDMGLGKTAQVIALLLDRLEARVDRAATLVVVPASVLPNWERELAAFAPSLQVIRHHGSSRFKRPEMVAHANQPGTVVLTTYATLRSTAKLLASARWERVVLDEAQNIKNSSAAQSRAARALDARHRLALTGTPVENRLDDLWSIMQFTNPGLLGGKPKFREWFAAPVERGDDRAADRLRALMRPFLLRRMKADPAIALDLPPKVESTIDCALTLEQATLYEAAVEQALADLEQLQGMRRRARVLTLLTELKQICNHPAQYLHEREPLAGRSGKFDRIIEMLDETIAEGDAALVFTQFAEMGRLLARHTNEVLDIDVPFLHGGLALPDRDEIVETFQHPAGPPVMVASLRAGGVGLNITRANHVIHYDRWWNPAVEDQATDRTHRIGQRNTVFVHRLQVAGTIEQRIDELISRKRSIAGQVVRAGEGWLTELPVDELRRLIELR